MHLNIVQHYEQPSHHSDWQSIGPKGGASTFACMPTCRIGILIIKHWNRGHKNDSPVSLVWSASYILRVDHQSWGGGMLRKFMVSFFSSESLLVIREGYSIWNSQGGTDWKKSRTPPTHTFFFSRTPQSYFLELPPSAIFYWHPPGTFLHMYIYREKH